MNLADLTFFYAPKERLRVTVGEEKSYLTVKPVWASPQSRPNRYLALLDGKGDEIIMLPDPKVLPQPAYGMIERELKLRYLPATVTAIVDARQEYGATYWSVETDRGLREFVTQSLQENALWFTDTHLLLLDVDGNRFEILDTTALDERSRGFISRIL